MPSGVVLNISLTLVVVNESIRKETNISFGLQSRKDALRQLQNLCTAPLYTPQNTSHSAPDTNRTSNNTTTTTTTTTTDTTTANSFDIFDTYISAYSTMRRKKVKLVDFPSEWPRARGDDNDSDDEPTEDTKLRKR